MRKNAATNAVTRVMVFGCFDPLHRGHENFFSQARRAGGRNAFLIAVVARDANVLLKKGQRPNAGESKRLKAVKDSRSVDSAVLGGKQDRFAVIRRLKPHVIALGYDQNAEFRLLLNACAKGFLKKIVRLKPFKPEIYKSSKIRASHG
ncbi:MAG: adenylyltransferase/cytidyltransferase family protein [Candidatus Micrarchaeota archaeon]